MATVIGYSSQAALDKAKSSGDSRLNSNNAKVVSSSGASSTKTPTKDTSGTTFTEGQMASDGSGVIKFDPNTGKPLAKGQTVTLNPINTQAVYGGSTVQNVPNVDASVIGTQKPLNLAQPSSIASDTNAFMNGVTAGLPPTDSPEVAALKQDQQKKMSLVEQLGNSLNLTKSLKTAEKAAGVPQLTRDLQNAKLQLAAIQSEAQTVNQNIAQETAPLGIVIGQQNEAQKTYALKVGAQAAVVAALSDNLDLANHYVDRALDLEYKTFQTQYDAAKYNLEQVNGLLTSAEKKQADAVSRQWDVYMQDRTELKNYKAELTKSALANGAPSSIISSIMTAGTVEDAIKSAGSYAVQSRGSSVPTLKEINGQTYQWNPSTQSWEVPVGTGVTQANEQSLSASENNINQLNSILNDGAIRSAVGPSGIARFVGRGWDTLTGARQNFLADVNQVASQLTIDSLTRAKQNGATFGALSDSERAVLANAGTKLNSWAIKDGSGNVTGYNVSEADFKKEIDKINNMAKLDYLLKGGSLEAAGAAMMPDGSVWVVNSDGTKTKLR